MDLLYLLEHCILKTSCEAIVESFCSIIGRHGSAGRHPEQGVYTKEAVVAANGPAMGHADDFLARPTTTYSQAITTPAGTL
jgi:hypothetical protein